MTAARKIERKQLGPKAEALCALIRLEVANTGCGHTPEAWAFYAGERQRLAEIVLGGHK